MRNKKDTTEHKPTSSEELRFILIEDAAARLGMSSRTLERLIADGDGPTITRLSSRRRRIRLDHLRSWSDARTG